MTAVYQDRRIRQRKPDPHVYAPDPAVPPPGRGRPRPCRCGVAMGNAIHDSARVAAAAAAKAAVGERQAEQRRWLGERED